MEYELKLITNDVSKHIQPRNCHSPTQLIFGMQPYFDPTRKTTSKKNGRRPQKK